MITSVHVLYVAGYPYRIMAHEACTVNGAIRAAFVSGTHDP